MKIRVASSLFLFFCSVSISSYYFLISRREKDQKLCTFSVCYIKQLSCHSKKMINASSQKQPFLTGFSISLDDFLAFLRGYLRKFSEHIQQDTLSLLPLYLIRIVSNMLRCFVGKGFVKSSKDFQVICRYCYRSFENTEKKLEFERKEKAACERPCFDTIKT